MTCFLSVHDAQANKQEKEKAKKERKEARKLAANPLQPETEDTVPRACVNAAEQSEVDDWIAQRKRLFPTAANVERKRAAHAAASQAGALPL